MKIPSTNDGQVIFLFNCKLYTSDRGLRKIELKKETMHSFSRKE